MCRFLAYFGSSPVVLAELIERPVNSLINQGRSPRLCKGISSDGFGVAWYHESFGESPSVYKSTQPAWNDPNVECLMNKMRSACFLGHVRAATVGGVSFSNCHPFVFENYSFVHNGTIAKVEHFRRTWLLELDQDLYEAIKGQTDSELLFYLIIQEIRRGKDFFQAISAVYEKIREEQSALPEEVYSFLNVALTDGAQMIAARYATNGGNPPSLFYSKSSGIGGNETSLVVSSEGLTECDSEWVSLNNGEMLWINKDQTLKVMSI